jgi:sterol desaturase/sphingolipid hydroxylase (fatty acid hydroxylase superfamily)
VSGTLATAGAILAVMALLAAIETLVPLHARWAGSRLHLRPNLLLTLMTFATNAVFNAALVLLLRRQEAAGVGLLHVYGVAPVVATAAVVLTLDFAYYLAHVGMHASPLLWRFHRVHHSDPAVDVTTTIRQHPGEGVIRYAVLAVSACGIGAAPAAFAVYRAWSVLHGLVEHANVRVPSRLDAAVSWVLTTPNMHKVHHSRRPAETNSNYGNVFAIFDRCFSTFTPTDRGLRVAYGLAGLDERRLQTTMGLLALPFRGIAASAAAVHERR